MVRNAKRAGALRQQQSTRTERTRARKGKKENPGKCSKCGPRRRKTEDCPAGSKNNDNKTTDGKGDSKG
eukprot:4982579-Pyramimonas_sp.AAC.1